MPVKSEIKCSFRSAGSWDVNQFARDGFNGGGHTNAAGGRMQKQKLEEVEQFFLEKVKENEAKLKALVSED